MTYTGKHAFRGGVGPFGTAAKPDVAPRFIVFARQQLEWAGIARRRCVREFRGTAANKFSSCRYSIGVLQRSGQGERLGNYEIAEPGEAHDPRCRSTTNNGT